MEEERGGRPFLIVLFLFWALSATGQDIWVQEARDSLTIKVAFDPKIQGVLTEGKKPQGFIPYKATEDSAIYAKAIRVAIPAGSHVKVAMFKESVSRLTSPAPSIHLLQQRGTFIPAYLISEPKIFRRVTYVDILFFPLQISREGVPSIAGAYELSLDFVGGEYGTITDSKTFEELYDGLFVNSWRDKGVPRSTLRQITPWQPPAHSGDVYRIKVANKGIYKIDYAFLAANSTWPVVTLDPRNFQLFYRGIQQPIYVSGQQDGVFQPGDAIFFYGTALEGENDSGVWQKGDFTDENVYWLLIGTQPGLRMSTRNVAPANGYSLAGEFTSTIHFEQNPSEFLFQTEPDSDLWLWLQAYWNTLGTSEPVQHHLVEVPSISSNNSFQAQLRFACRGRSYSDSVNPDHHVVLRVNGTEIGNFYLDGYQPGEQTYSFSQGLLGSGGTATVDISHEVMDPSLLGLTIDRVQSNWFEITYSRMFEAYNDRLEFSFDQEGNYRFQIPKFTTDEIVLLDTTLEAAPVLLENAVVNNISSLYEVVFEDEIPAEGRKYFAALPSTLSSSDFVVDTPSNLAGISAATRWILILPDAWKGLPEVENLLNLRQAQGLNPVAVSVEDIYDEFSYGIFTPYAIRDFLEYVYNLSSSPVLESVVLLGDADYDYKDYAGNGNFNFVPTFMVADPGLAGFFHPYPIHSFDNYFGSFLGNDSVPEIFIGRIPARSPGEAAIALAKVVDYEAPADLSWVGRNLLMADCQDAQDFEAQQETNASLIGPVPPHTVTRLYFAEAPWNCSTNDANQNNVSDVVDEINQGVLITSWLGHGAFNVIGQNSYLQSSDVADLTNGDRLTVFLSGNCYTGAFYHATVQTLYEEMFGSSNGIVSGLSPGTYMWVFQSPLVSESFFEDVYGRNKIRLLGPLYQKIFMNLDASGDTRLAEGMVAFGDPASKLPLPTPSAPLNFQINPSTCGTLDLVWDPPGPGFSGGYNVYRSTTAGGPFQKLNPVPLSTTGYTDEGLVNGTTYYYYVAAVDTAGYEGYGSSILPHSVTGLSLSPSALTSGRQDVSYSVTFTTSGGTPPYNFSVTSGALPGGLSLSPDGILSGTPTENGSFNFVITVTDGSLCGTQSYSLIILPPCLFCDDFEDSSLSSEWTYKGDWSETGGYLIGVPIKKKASAIATPVFSSGCSSCTVQAKMRTAGGLFNKVWLLGWYQDKRNTVELLMKEESDRWILKQRVNGVVVAKGKVNRTILPNVTYTATITFDGNQFQLFIDGDFGLSMFRGAGTSPAGTVGFQVKSTTGFFDEITVY